MTPAGALLIAFTHVTVIDGTGRPPQPDMTVIVRDGRIAAVGPSARTAPPPGARVVDGRGRFVIPGLWDMHVHLQLGDTDRMMALFVANGVLGVRDTAAAAEKVFAWREEVASGRRLGPRIVAGGPQLDGPDPPLPEIALSVRDAREARAAVERLQKLGADFVKVHDGVPREAYFAVADEARQRGLPFVGHVPPAVTAFEAAEAGQKSIEHLAGVIQSLSEKEDEIRAMTFPPPRPGDFSAIPARLAIRGNLALDTQDPDRLLRLSALFVRKGVWQVPTLVNGRSRAFIDELAAARDDRLRFASARTRERWKPENDFFARYRTPEYIAYIKRDFRRRLEVIGEMRRRGVRILAGTDVPAPYLYAGFSLHDELALLVEAGLSPMEALQAATSGPAEFLGLSKDEGTVEAGKVANLVVLTADPLQDIRNVGRIESVVMRGRLIDPAERRRMLKAAEPEP
ncbi:MAG TPA: amidohydrolase family protein [Vicinamibacteria bacterium]|nr:amidohydrolase family protein [Vicinamibacteria bacterium]